MVAGQISQFGEFQAGGERHPLGEPTRPARTQVDPFGMPIDPHHSIYTTGLTAGAESGDGGDRTHRPHRREDGGRPRGARGRDDRQDFNRVAAGRRVADAKTDGGKKTPGDHHRNAATKSDGVATAAGGGGTVMPRDDMTPQGLRDWAAEIQSTGIDARDWHRGLVDLHACGREPCGDLLQLARDYAMQNLSNAVTVARLRHLARRREIEAACGDWSLTTE